MTSSKIEQAEKTQRMVQRMLRVFSGDDQQISKSLEDMRRVLSDPSASQALPLLFKLAQEERAKALDVLQLFLLGKSPEKKDECADEKEEKIDPGAGYATRLD